MYVPAIRLLCLTRWTVSASALTSISEDYEALVETWGQANEIVSDSEMRARIGGVAKQMETFDFFFGVELGRIVLNMADNLSKALQGSSLSASDGQSLMKMTVATIQSMRSDESFTSFWQIVETKHAVFKSEIQCFHATEKCREDLRLVHRFLRLKILLKLHVHTE